MIVRGITGSKSLVSGRSLGPLYLKSGGKTYDALGYASYIFDALLCNVRQNVVSRVWYMK